MDIRVKTERGDSIDIEMQINHLDGYIKRSLFYNAKLLSEGLEAGSLYGTMKKSIVISILRYKKISTNEELTDISELHFLERFGAYLRYAAEPGKEDYIRELLSYGEEVIGMSEQLLQKASEEEKLREWQRARDKFLIIARKLKKRECPWMRLWK